jgi:murein DD-endopeptidase MepM/ murein hydrolase activator NlpD
LPAEKRQILAYCMHLKDKLLDTVFAACSAMRSSRKARSVSAYALLLSFIAFGAAGVSPTPDVADLPVTLTVEELALPDLAAQISAINPDSQQFTAEERVRSGDSLGALLERLGVNDVQAANFIKSDEAAKALLRLRPGRIVRATVTSGGKLLTASTLITESKAAVKNLSITRTDTGFVSQETEAAIERRTEMRTAEIRSTLFAATDAAQIPDAVAMQMVEIFSSDIDFGSDLRRGDYFKVIYETLWQGGEFVRGGRVLGAEFHNGSKTFQAVWFGQPDSDEGGYYDMNGKSLKKAFLKSPLEFSRVTSGFSMRIHPISGQWKQHKGIDFAAATGTAIRAAGDGVVDFAGVQGGYGNMVVIQHGSNYSTAYAHMSHMAVGLRRGSKVKQGEVIGYVGMTGWSTGPHLHYEFRVGNEARNPDSIAVPEAPALAGLDLQYFHRYVSTIAHRFVLLDDKDVQIAAR